MFLLFIILIFFIKTLQKLSRDLEEILAGDYLYLCSSIVTEPNIFLIKEINTLLTVSVALFNVPDF